MFFDRKIFVLPEDVMFNEEETRHHVPEEILNSSVNKIISKMMRVFPSIRLDIEIQSAVCDTIDVVDRIVASYLGGSQIKKKALCAFVDITFEKEVMFILSNALAAAGKDVGGTDLA
jgi:hypothetical protein